MVESAGVKGKKGSSSLRFGCGDVRAGEAEAWLAEPLTTEKVFHSVVSKLLDMGYHCSSMEKSEDFTERIDGLLSKQIGSENQDQSGYPRILTVYHSGGRIRVELYNFLKEFPTDNEEMDEIKESLNKIFQANHKVNVDVHE